MSFSLYSHNSLCGVKFAALMTRTVKIGVECPNPDCDGEFVFGEATIVLNASAK